MGGLKPCRGTSVHVAFQLSHEPLLWVGNEKHLGEGAERQTPLRPRVRQPPFFFMWKGNSGEKGDTISVACYLLLVVGKSWGGGHKWHRFPCRSDFGPWRVTGRETAMVKCSPGNLFVLLDASSPTHLSVNVRYGALLKLCK